MSCNLHVHLLHSSHTSTVCITDQTPALCPGVWLCQTANTYGALHKTVENHPNTQMEVNPRPYMVALF